MSRRSLRRMVASLALVAATTGAGGCAATDAVLDGLYVGVSDTVATIISNALSDE